MGAVLRYLWPVLSSAGKTGRVYYRAVCPPDLRYYPLRFPQIDVQPPSEIGTDLAIVQSIFRRDHDVAVTEDKNGIVRVRIGEVPDTVLRTRISTLSFNWDTQYNVLTAISAIESAPEVQSAMRTLKVSSTARVYNYRVLHPAAGRPHLPAEVSNVTVDQALDMVARTWGGIVFYGACTEPSTYEIYFAGSIY